ncbi:hypothetical protein CGC21_17065 [Leishmania donovani]|uniref:Uncharacterized protein n=1 Tax=Leishmania donovani TaxID=5661 RepID=A0A504XVY7_LEIDO|nr:hypothetical protein CGC21_17065 [Leishmania donovani]
MPLSRLVRGHFISLLHFLELHSATLTVLARGTLSYVAVYETPLKDGTRGAVVHRNLKSELITAVELHPSTLVAAPCDPRTRLDRNVRERRPKVPLEDVLCAPLNCSSVCKVFCAAMDHEEYHLWPLDDSLLNTHTALARGEARECEDGRHPAGCVAEAGRQASDVLIRVFDGASRQELCRSLPKFTANLVPFLAGISATSIGLSTKVKFPNVSFVNSSVPTLAKHMYGDDLRAPLHLGLLPQRFRVSDAPHGYLTAARHALDNTERLLAKQLSGCRRACTGAHAGTHGAMVPLSDTLTLFFNDLRVKLRFFEDPLNTLIVLPGHGNHMGHHYKYTHAGKCERVLHRIGNFKSRSARISLLSFQCWSKQLSTSLDVCPALVGLCNASLAVYAKFNDPGIARAACLLDLRDETLPAFVHKSSQLPRPSARHRNQQQLSAAPTYLEEDRHFPQAFSACTYSPRTRHRPSKYPRLGLPSAGVSARTNAVRQGIASATPTWHGWSQRCSTVPPRGRLVLAGNCTKALVHPHAKAAAAIVALKPVCRHRYPSELRTRTPPLCAAAARPSHIGLSMADCESVHQKKLGKHAKSAMAEESTPTGQATDLATGLRRQADIPLLPARQEHTASAFPPDPGRGLLVSR